MKVLLVSPLPPPVGGIAKVTINIINYFTENPKGISFVICNTAHSFRSVTSHSLILRFFTGFSNSIYTFFQVRKLIRSDKPQVIHLSSSSSLALFKDLLIVKYARFTKIPVVVHWHFGRIPNLEKLKNWEWKMLCSVLHYSTSTIVIDTRSYKTLLKAGFKNVFNIPNPLGAETVKLANSILEKKLERKPGRLIFVGHIIKSKGVYDLVEACSQLLSVEELLLIGPYRQVIKDELVKIGSTRESGNWLKFTGELADDKVLEFMFSSYVLALPSYTEGFPNVVLEAMTMGCAVIATDVGAIPEMLDLHSPEPCGICISPHIVDLLKNAISELFGDLNLAKIMGRNGIARVSKYYSNKIVVEQYRNIWESALNR